MIAGGFGKFRTRKAMQSIRLHCWGGALRRTYRAVVSTPLSRQGNDGVLELAMNFIKRTANLHERHAVRLFGLHWNTTKKLTFTYFWTREKFSSLAKEHFETNVNCSSRAAAHLLHPGLSSSSLWWHRFFPSSVTFCSVGSRCCNSHTANVVVVRLRGRPIRYGASAACSRYAISRDIPYRPATTVNSFFAIGMHYLRSSGADSSITASLLYAVYGLLAIAGPRWVWRSYIHKYIQMGCW